MAQPADDAAPKPTAPAPSAPASIGSAGIGEVLSLLRPEFPDVSISKIRFLETEGLVAPARTRSGYRRFTATDVQRLRWVLQVQRDRYLPLRVIKSHLDTAGPGALPTQPPAAPAPAAPAPSAPVSSAPVSSAPVSSAPVSSAPVSVPTAAGTAPATAVTSTLPPRVGRGRRLHRDELLEATGLSPAALVEMEGFGLVRGRSGWYGPDDVAVGHTVARLAAFGIGPRHLRGLRSAADREIGLLEQVLAPQLRSRRPDARARAEESAAELRELTRRLHDALVAGALRDMGVDPR